MSHRTTTVEVSTSRSFDYLLEARQRLRTLVVHHDPEQATWSLGSHPPARPANPDRPMALALLGVHDTLEAAIAEHIDELRDREEAEETGRTGPAWEALARTLEEHDSHGLTVDDGAIRCNQDGSVLVAL